MRLRLDDPCKLANEYGALVNQQPETSQQPKTAERRKEPPEPYKTLGPRAHFYKALIQMIIGVVGAGVVCYHLLADVFSRQVLAKQASEHLFLNVGITLGAAAVIELAYTLFTHGADEAVDPIMLGLAAAMLVQFGQAGVLDLKQGVAALLYVAALGGLFLVKERLIRLHEVPSWRPSWWKLGDKPDDAASRPTGTANESANRTPRDARDVADSMGQPIPPQRG
jgi:hypothetical protein